MDLPQLPVVKKYSLMKKIHKSFIICECNDAQVIYSVQIHILTVQCILSYLPCIIIALKFVYVFLKYLNQCWDFLYTVTHMIICYMEKHLQKCALF